jgi:hypothetical protein
MQQNSQNILHGDTLNNIKRKKYIMVCAELPFPKLAKVNFDRMVIIFYDICNKTQVT